MYLLEDKLFCVLKYAGIKSTIVHTLINIMYTPTAKGYFSGCGGMEIGIMQAGVNVIQSLDLDPEATACMHTNRHYFSHSVLTKI